MQEVWISPLRRAIETAYHMFKDHPNFEKIKFKIKPYLREKIRVCGDIPSGNSLDEFKEMIGGRLEC